MELPERKQNRILDYDYSQNGAYFITICTKDRKPLLSDIEGDEAFIILKPYGEIAERWIRMISEKYPQVTVDKYVIMPDHIHMVFRIDSVGEAFRLPCDSDAMQKDGTGNPSPTVESPTTHPVGEAFRLPCDSDAMQKERDGKPVPYGGTNDGCWLGVAACEALPLAGRG